MESKNSIIKTEGLTKRYGSLTAVNGLNLEIREGEVFGLLGPNGAGKTTTILMLLGLTEPSEGKATISGFNCTREPIAVKRIVGYMPDNVGFYGDMTGRENLRFTGALNGVSKEETEKRIDSLITRVGLQHAADRRVSTYSRGMKQRLGIADVLMKDPKVVILDEPTLGIDPEGIHELMVLIRQLAEEDGRTVLLSSHQLYQVQQICDRVGIFVKGSLIACGNLEELSRNKSGVHTLEFAAQPDDENLNRLIRAQDGVQDVRREKAFYLIDSMRDIRTDLAKAALESGYSLCLVRERIGDLDDIYRSYFARRE